MTSRVGHLFVAGVSGFTILVLEFAAVRQLAPAFGQSNYVWANVIGVILFALALGYVAGGRIGERSRSGRPLYVAYGVVALYTVGLAFLGPALCEALIPRGLPGDRLLPLGFTGSLLATLLLFAPPVFLLAMTSPFLIRLEARKGREGRATGGLYAVGTLGSLAACYLAPLVLLQVWGTRATLLFAAGCAGLLCVGGLVLVRGGSDAAPEVRDPPPAARERIRVLYILTALVTGWAVTVLEFGAVRFMAPWFGQSNYIWANVIGLMLLSLAAGSWIGGRWADAALERGAVGGRSLFGALAAAATLVALATLWGPGLLGWLMPDGVYSGHILPIAFQGSMAASLLLFSAPMVLLGSAAPFLVRMGAPAGHAGRTAGVLFAWTTVGGLIGCFVTAPLLVPALGARGTLLLPALALGSLALWALRPQAWREVRGARTPALAGAGLALTIALFGWHLSQGTPLRTHAGQVVEVESAYQTIRVVRARVPLVATSADGSRPPATIYHDGGEAKTVFLRHDEDAETYQSILLENTTRRREWLTGGRYFEHMALGAHFARPQRDGPLRVLIIGYAGGTVYRTLKQTAGQDLAVLGVEIDPAVIDVARDHLRHAELEGKGLRLVTGEDARTVVNALPEEEQFDLVLVDAYARTNYVPFQLASTEFFQRVRKQMAPGAWIGVNVLGHGMRGAVAKAVASTMGSVFGEAFAAPNVAFPGNVILWSSPGAKHGPRVSAKAVMHPGLRSAAFMLERLMVRHDRQRDGGIVLTDDRSPSDRLADEELGM